MTIKLTALGAYEPPPEPQLPDIHILADESACFVNWLNVLVFGDETIRLSFGETISENHISSRGTYRMTLGKAFELAQALHNMVQTALAMRAERDAARNAMN